MKYIFDDEEIEAHFSECQIKHYMKQNNLTRLESLFYLWAFNNFSVHSPDDLKDYGRPMYIKLARRLRILFEQCSTEIKGSEE